MYRSVLFLLLIAAAALGAAWVADQAGNVMLTWDGWRIETSLPVFALAVGVTIVAAMLMWSILRGLWRAPGKIRRSRRERRHARGRHAITHGLLAIGHGDASAARAHADAARRHAANDPLALLLHAQSAQLEGDRERAKAAFRAMAEREDTRLLGLRGLFIEAQRADDPLGAVMIAEEALKLSPASTWASHAVLGFRCVKGDWSGALAILDKNLAAGLMDKSAYRRQRGVLLTARALELETVDPRRIAEDAVDAYRSAADEAGVRLELVVGEDAPGAMDADPVRLSEVLANLLTNAIRHGPAGTSVTVHLRSAGRDVVFEVDDDGPGIPIDQVPFVFDRFVTSADTGGTGLGLAIAKRLVEAHGGTIEAITPNGGGTQMRVQIPVGDGRP